MYDPTHCHNKKKSATIASGWAGKYFQARMDLEPETYSETANHQADPPINTAKCT